MLLAILIKKTKAIIWKSKISWHIVKPAKRKQRKKKKKEVLCLGNTNTKRNNRRQKVRSSLGGEYWTLLA